MRFGLAIRIWFCLFRRLSPFRRRGLDILWVDDDPPACIPTRLPIRVSVVDLEQQFKLPDGFAVEHLDEPEQLRDDACHIVVVTVQNLKAAMRYARGACLIVCAGSFWGSSAAAMRLKSGVALTIVPEHAIVSFMEIFAEQLALDQRISDAVRGDGDQSNRTTRPPDYVLLVINRRLNHALRLSAFAEVLDMEAQLAGMPRLEHPQRDLWSLMSWKKEIESVKVKFDCVRAADVSILHSVHRHGRTRVVAPGTTLEMGRDYILQVHVGGKLKFSLLSDPDREDDRASAPCPIGDGENDLIEAVLQPKDFISRGPVRLEIPVPQAGSSRFQYFSIRAPLRPGPATLRISFFRRNQMVEAFSIESQVTEWEHALASRDMGVRAKLEFSETSSYSEISKIENRALTITVNRSTDSHSILLKGDDALAGFSINEAQIEEWTGRYRELLLNASFLDPEAGTKRDLDDKGAGLFIWQLAHLGGKLYRGYFDHDNGALVKVLEKIRNCSDQTISIVRHDASFAFPWPVFYDWPLSFRVQFNRLWDGAAMCLGTRDGVSCGHTPESGVFCVRGFWGYRHRIEELIGGGTERPRIEKIPRRLGGKQLQFVVSTQDESIANSIRRELSTMGDAADPETFLNDLWMPYLRPPIVLVLGHLEEHPVFGPRIAIKRNESRNPVEWLTAEEIAQRCTFGKPWGAPQSIVLVLACESGGTSARLPNDFILAFHKAHAAAVVGVEIPAFSDLLHEFGRQMTAALLEHGLSLGQSMTGIRRELLEKRNPLAFVFVCIGNSDLRVTREGDLS